MKVTVGVAGFGEIQVEVPSVPDEATQEAITDAVADAVAKTVTLIEPRTQQQRFHPVLGIGGYA
jgi:hypothetical protein